MPNPWPDASIQRARHGERFAHCRGAGGAVVVAGHGHVFAGVAPPLDRRRLAGRHAGHPRRLAAWFLLSPKYIAFGKVRVAYEQPGFRELPGGSGGNFLSYLKTQAAFLTSRPVIWAALKRDELKRLNLEALTGKDPAQYIEEELKIEFQDGLELVTVQMSSNDSQVSRAIVQAVMDSYMDEIVFAETQAHEKDVAELNKVLSAANATLKQKQDSLAQMAKNAGNIDPQLVPLRLSELQASIREANSQRSKIRLDVKQAEVDLVSHEARMKSLKESAVAPTLVDVALRSDPGATPHGGDQAPSGNRRRLRCKKREVRRIRRCSPPGIG